MNEVSARRPTMRRQCIHHIITIGLVLPVLGIATYGAINSPFLLNPWNTELFGELWIMVLPPLVCSIAASVNAVVGMFSIRARAEA